jgi:CspA family cold shock protein
VEVDPAPPPIGIIVAEFYGGTAFRRERGRKAAVARSAERKTTVHKGIVKWFNPTKGYGFIERTNGGKDVFIHISAVERAGLSTLVEGQNVTFDIVANRGKEAAENLKLAR